MPFPLALPLLGMGISAISGMFGRKNTQQQTNTNTNTHNNVASSTPTLAPQYEGIQNAIMPMIMKRLSGSTGLPAGVAERGIADIGRTHDLVKQRSDNNLTSRGLGTSPVAAHVDAIGERARAGDIADFHAKTPMMEREFQNDDLAQAMTLMNFGKGTTSTSAGAGTGTGGGTGTGTSGGGIGGAMGDVGSMLGFLIGQGAFGGGAKPRLPGSVTNLSGSLPQIRY